MRGEFFMKKNVYYVCVRLSEKEFRHLNYLTQKSKLSRSKVLRKCIMNAKIHEAPKIIDSELKYQIAKIGNNINQLAHIANISGEVQFEPFLIEFENLKRKVGEAIGDFESIS
jgi:hypothetical protein